MLYIQLLEDEWLYYIASYTDNTVQGRYSQAATYIYSHYRFLGTNGGIMLHLWSNPRIAQLTNKLPGCQTKHLATYVASVRNFRNFVIWLATQL